MLPYSTIADAEVALGRTLTTAETFWLQYSSRMPNYLLYYHTLLFLFLIFTLAPLPVALVQLKLPSCIHQFKIQPKVHHLPSEFFKCYKAVVRVFLIAVGPLQILSYPISILIGIRTGLPLPSPAEVIAQLVVYFVIEDYGSYWIHRMLHGEWWYDKIHRVHHEITAPVGFAASYAHWAEILLFGIPAVVGPVLVPCHVTVFWFWFVLRQIEAIDTHIGYNFPFSPTKLIPFYGGAEYHDYHHYVGGKSKTNLASVFTYCDYIYGTDKGYKYNKANLVQMKQEWNKKPQNGNFNGFGEDNKIDQT